MRGASRSFAMALLFGTPRAPKAAKGTQLLRLLGDFQIANLELASLTFGTLSAAHCSACSSVQPGGKLKAYGSRSGIDQPVLVVSAPDAAATTCSGKPEGKRHKFGDRIPCWELWKTCPACLRQVARCAACVCGGQSVAEQAVVFVEHGLCCPGVCLSQPLAEQARHGLSHTSAPSSSMSVRQDEHRGLPLKRPALLGHVPPEAIPHVAFAVS